MSRARDADGRPLSRRRRRRPGRASTREPRSSTPGTGRWRCRSAPIAIARLAPPSTADELALEAVAAAGWQAEETERLGGWLLRAGSRASPAGRTRCCRCARRACRSTRRSAARARWYAERGPAAAARRCRPRPAGCSTPSSASGAGRPSPDVARDGGPARPAARRLPTPTSPVEVTAHVRTTPGSRRTAAAPGCQRTRPGPAHPARPRRFRLGPPRTAGRWRSAAASSTTGGSGVGAVEVDPAQRRRARHRRHGRAVGVGTARRAPCAATCRCSADNAGGRRPVRAARLLGAPRLPLPDGPAD